METGPVASVPPVCIVHVGLRKQLGLVSCMSFWFYNGNLLCMFHFTFCGPDNALASCTHGHLVSYYSVGKRRHDLIPKPERSAL